MDDGSKIKTEVQKVKAWYDLTAKDFDRRYDGVTGEYWFQFEDVIVDSLVNCDGKVVLDLGTGAGRYAIHMALKAKEVHGIDISSEMIRLAKEKSVGQENLNFEIGDSMNLRFKSNHFDLVTSLGMFESLQDPAPFLKEIYRVLKSGSEFVFTCFTFQSTLIYQRLYRAGLGFLFRNRYIPRPYSSDTMVRQEEFFHKISHRYSDIQNLLEQIGFRDADCKSTFFYFPTLLFYWGVAIENKFVKACAIRLNQFLGAFFLTKKMGPVIIIKVSK